MFNVCAGHVSNMRCHKSDVNQSTTQVMGVTACWIHADVSPPAMRCIMKRNLDPWMHKDPLLHLNEAMDGWKHVAPRLSSLFIFSIGCKEDLPFLLLELLQGGLSDFGDGWIVILPCGATAYNLYLNGPVPCVPPPWQVDPNNILNISSINSQISNLKINSPCITHPKFAISSTNHKIPKLQSPKP